MHSTVIPTSCPQAFDIVPSHLGWAAGQLLAVFQQRLGRLVEARLAPIDLDCISDCAGDLSPEVLPVRLDSIVTVVRLGYDDRQHLALRSGKRRRTVHDSLV